MDKKCTYGPLLREYRQKHGISLWNLAIRVPYRQGNLQRIERGITEPRVGLAMRLLMAIGVDTGNFMLNLAINAGLRIDAGETRTRRTEGDGIENLLPEHRQNAAYFGYLLRKTRLIYGQSQKNLAEEAGYTVRNLINVENGRQEPGIMTALKLVCATGCDVAWFFNELTEYYALEHVK